MSAALTDDDRRQLAARGIDEAEAERQIALLRRPRRYVELVRPCTVGDGVEALSAPRRAELLEQHAAAAGAGRFVKFVPASGAATRMFRELLRFDTGPDRGVSWDEIVRRAAAGDAAAATVASFVDRIDEFAFVDALERRTGRDAAAWRRVAAGGDYTALLDAVLGDDGLCYARLPKGLLAFHAYPGGSRTPLEEHLVEAASYTRDGAGRCRLHFTVSPEHEEGFRRRLAEVGGPLGARLDASFEVGYSHQHPATDTLAVDPSGALVRDAGGALLLRPAGHGALIRNLDALDADLVYVKNIDNVQPDRLKAPVVEWKRALGGYLVELQASVFAAIERLRAARSDQDAADPAIAEVGRLLHLGLNGRPGARPPEARRRQLLAALDRPIRVCGVVRNTGEPGGGPFWVRGSDGKVTPQIVEAAEVDPHDPAQQAIFRASTHFNPVDLALSLRGPGGARYDLSRFVDEDRVIVARKSADGHDLLALERPGLWNGAMAAWSTVFVEVPLETFTPVKSVLDLLRGEHQGRGRT